MGRSLFESTARPSSSAAADKWYDRRDLLQIERAGRRGDLVVEIGKALRFCALAHGWRSNPSTVQILEEAELLDDLLRTVLYTGHESYAAAAATLDECFTQSIAARNLQLPSFAAYLAWLRAADARLGECPR